MYIPTHFKLEDKDLILKIIRENSFGILISNSTQPEIESEPFATHIPLLVDENLTRLTGHFARLNPQWKDLEDKTVLCIFHGPHSYISSSWYEEMPSVPTWNYLSVHVYGRFKRLKGNGKILQSLNDLVQTFESEPSGYSLDQLDEEYLDNLSKGILPFQIEITRIQAKAKLSQNHSESRRNKVIDRLKLSNSEQDQAIAEWMRMILNQSS